MGDKTKFSPREAEVWVLFSRGLKPAQIAAELDINITAVYKYFRSIKARMRSREAKIMRDLKGIKNV